MKGPADAYPFPTLPALVRICLALAVVGAVFAVSWSADRVIDDGGKFLMLGTAVMACAWFAGTGPALAATVMAALLGAFEATYAPGESAATQTHLALFLIQLRVNG